MPHITLIRHGIAEDKKIGQADFVRVLTHQWRKKFLWHIHKDEEQLYTIDMIICSPAIRCRQTCSLLASVINIDPDWIVYDNRIYTFENSYDTLLEVLQSVPWNKQHICLIWHNDSISSLASHLKRELITMKKWKIIHTIL